MKACVAAAAAEELGVGAGAVECGCNRSFNVSSIFIRSFLGVVEYNAQRLPTIRMEGLEVGRCRREKMPDMMNYATRRIRRTVMCDATLLKARKQQLARR